MKREQVKKVVAVACCVVLVVNLVLVAFGLMTWQLFWMIIIACAIIAWYVIPEKKASD